MTLADFGNRGRGTRRVRLVRAGARSRKSQGRVRRTCRFAERGRVLCRREGRRLRLFLCRAPVAYTTGLQCRRIPCIFCYCWNRWSTYHGTLRPWRKILSEQAEVVLVCSKGHGANRVSRRAVV